MNKVFIIIFILFCSSCREPVNEDLYLFPKIPILNGIIRTGHLIQVHLSYTGLLDNTALETEEDAIIILSSSAGSDTLIYEGKGMYVSDLIAEADAYYECQVGILDKFFLSSVDSIPPLPVLTSVEYNAFAGVDEEGLTFPSVKVSFLNNPLVNSFYEIKIWLLGHGEANLIQITDPVLLKEGLPILLFKNENISSNSYTMTISYNSGTFDNNMPLVVELRSVSRNYYKYVRSKYIYELGRYPEFGKVTTPNSLYTNVNDGYGIFAGYSTVFSDTIYPQLHP